MPRLSRTTLILAACAPLLSACGEGWVAQPIRNVVPYTEERTAGPGVAYVRAYMMPEKGPVLEPLGQPVSEPMESAAPIFEQKQLKVKAAPAAAPAMDPAPVADPAMDPGPPVMEPAPAMDPIAQP